MRVALTIGSLLALLALALWSTYGMWHSAVGDLPAMAYITMAATLLVSLLVGSGLMALMFYSSRRGYDEAAASRSDRRRED